MNTLKTLIAATVLSLGLLPVMAQAQTKTSGKAIPSVEHRQHHRIRHGVKSGELTRKEATRLRAREKSIKTRARIQRHDGKGLNAAERKRIGHSLHRTSKAIHRQSHDGQKRP